MSITGNILIDKLRINIPLETLKKIHFDENNYENTVRETLAKHFFKGSFSVNKSYNCIKITLTPTRFKSDENNISSDVNLEMPSESWLLNVFKDLEFDGKELNKTVSIVWIHLTKNILTKKSPSNYIKFLSNYPLKKGFIHSLISSNRYNTSLRIATPKQKTQTKDFIGDRAFIFYDKVQELLDKSNKNGVYLKSPLTKPEIKAISTHGGWYNPESSFLRIGGLNLLRCELQYRYKNKIAPLQHFLNPKSQSDSLTMDTMLNLLKNQELYSKLNEFFTQELTSVIFYKALTQEETHLSSYQRAFVNLITNNDIVDLQLVYDSLELGHIFKRNVAKFYSGNNSLYSELYQKLILQSSST